MSIELCVLASGSSGNCTVVRSPGGVMLIDAGLGPRLTAQRLAGTGVSVADVTAVCLTHLDRDHFNLSWLSVLERRGIALYCHADKAGEVASDAAGRGFATAVRTFGTGPFEPLPGLEFKPIHLSHDGPGSHGFVIEGFDCRIGYATDLGHVPEELIEQFCDLDVLAIESNYDQRMQVDSPRPWFLKRRIMGGRGHLSNEQAFDAVRRVLNKCDSRGRPLPSHIVLLHRSRQCNCPNLLRRFFARDARVAPRLTLAEQDERSPWLGSRRVAPLTGEQLELAWG